MKEDPRVPVLEDPDVESGRVALSNVRWSTYEALLADTRQASGTRIFFDRGELEIVTPSPLHERIGHLLGRFIDSVSLEKGIPVRGQGATTWRRRDLGRGFEADLCYYVGHEISVRGKDAIDLARDPPPDLIVEIDISRSSEGRRSMYAAFGIPELWHNDGERTEFRVLGENGYTTTERSLAFPFLLSSDIDRFLARRNTTDETTLLAEFRDWVRALPAE